MYLVACYIFLLWNDKNIFSNVLANFRAPQRKAAVTFLPKTLFLRLITQTNKDVRAENKSCY